METGGRFVETRLLSVNPDSPEPGVIREAAGILRGGGVVAFPTETVYGLGADALNAEAVSRIFAAKGRPARNPIIVHVRSIERARELASQWPPAAQSLAERFWPGPLTLVLKKRSCVPDVVTAGRDTVALRCPNHAVALALLEAAGCPIAAPSANLSEQLSPTLAAHVVRSLGGRIEMILDGGPAAVGLESTVVDMTTQSPRLLRPGAVSLDSLRDVCGGVEIGTDPVSHEEALESPGQMHRHYSPRTRMICCDATAAELTVLAELEKGRNVGWLRWGAESSGVAAIANRSGATIIDMPIGAESYAARLYATLHELDAAGLDLIVATLPPDTEAWRAVRDRLRRAASSITPASPVHGGGTDNSGGGIVE